MTRILTGLFCIVTLACTSVGDDLGSDTQEITYYEDVAPILIENCVACHSDDPDTRIAPFSLASYDEAAMWAEAGLVSYVVESRIMPPWSANNDGDCGTYKDALWLTADEIATIVAWADGERAAGDPAAMPPIPPPAPGLASPTRTVEMDMEYVSGSPADDDIRCFVLDPGNPTDEFLVAFNFISSNYAVSHHAVVFDLGSAADDAEAAARDAADPGPGYGCLGDALLTGATRVAGWVPGMGPIRLPEGTGIKLRGGGKLVLQMHFNYVEERAAAKIALELETATSVSRVGQLVAVQDFSLALAPGQDRVENEYTQPVPPGPFKVWGVLPHMHWRGVDMAIDLADATETRCVARIESWDFDWQRMYWYEQPLSSAGGGDLRITCGYDTRGDETAISFGEGTADEMCYAGFYVTAD